MSNVLLLGESERRLTGLFGTLTADTAEVRDGYPPFRWQKRLLKRLLDEDIPQAVDVPTGLGKTSVMALWLIALAEGADLPRRLVYVVDRRAVVDQATRYAERLRENLPADLASSLGLDTSAGGLPISTLRGGFADNREWLEDPSKPAVIVGTVDMIGSQMLFEGYGVSRRMRPYHAGLLGVDALVLLDEAHLCPPFEAMLRQVAALRAGESGSNGNGGWSLPPFRLMSLSATGHEASEVPPSKVFKLDPQDREEAEVRRRLHAKKRLHINQLDDISTLTEQVANRAVPLACQGDSFSRVIVFCDKRKDALDVKQRIEKQFKGNRGARNVEDSCHLELLVGERRVRERSDLERWLDEQGFLGVAKTPAQRPTFLVATSAGEVGVDLNADHMVCDLVAYERMVQRLGRVNRRGGDDRRALVDVFCALPPARKGNASQSAKERYAGQLEAFENRLRALHFLPAGDDNRRDASPFACGELKLNHAESVNAATTPQPLHPALSRPLLDAWSMTSLSQHSGRPEVSPWLRGWIDEDEPQTDVAWRRYLPQEHREFHERSVRPDVISDFFRHAPIHASERLEAVSRRVFDWLLKRAGKIRATTGESGLVADGESTLTDDGLVVAVLDRSGECTKTATLRDLRYLAAPAKNLSKQKRAERDREKRDWIERHLPGAVLVVDARVGGLSRGMLDETAKAMASAADLDADWKAEVEDWKPEAHRPLIKFRMQEVTATGEEEEGLQPPTPEDGWHHVRTYETHIDAAGAAKSGLAILNWHDAAVDEDAKAFLSRPQLLRHHAEQASDHARRIGERLGLPTDVIDALATAARLHDDGKAASHWQRAMNAPEDGVYAKTKGGGNLRLLGGYRHEFGSLLKAEREALPDGTRDLILHLIAAHHGYARPLISHRGCEEGAPSHMESKAGEAALRFSKLQRKYGPWELAWLEALLRAADQSASREWSREAAGGNHG